MDMDWIKGILQSLFADWLKWILIAFVSVIVGWAKSKDWRWATPLLYGLVAAATVFMLIGGIDKADRKSRSEDITSLSSKDLETKLRGVLDALGYKTGSNPNVDTIFRFTVTDINGVNVNVHQPKNYPSTIGIFMLIKIPPDMQRKIAKLNEKDRTRLVRELGMTVNRQGVLRSGLVPPITTITLEDPFLKDDLQNLSLFTYKVRSMFLTFYSIMGTISAFID